MKSIEVYTSDRCPECKKLKEYLENNKIEFKEYNIFKDTEAKRRLISLGYLSVPLAVIDENHVLGFDLNRINQLLEIKK